MKLRWILLLLALTAPGVAMAQLVPLQSLPQPLARPLGQVEDTLSRIPLVDEVQRNVRQLARDRIGRIRKLHDRFPDQVAIGPDGNAVRAREVVVTDPDDSVVAAAQAAGFTLIERTQLADVGVGFARFRTPDGLSLKRALKQLRKAAPGHDISTDPIHFESGHGSLPATPAAAGGEGAASTPVRIGIIDGGVSDRLTRPAEEKGFATGAPVASDHATGIASLIVGGDGIRGAAPDARLYVADVYGRDPAGGNATAIARALAWMVSQHVPVVSVSLVGPQNPLLARVVAAARARGTIVVAAVGNDGPASPPAYPASYPGTIAVTGVDGHDRALIEAGRATHLDYAAPAADMLAADAAGRSVTVRGTSFAAPFVAARLALAYSSPDPARLGSAMQALDRQARDLGRRGPDNVFGRGLICGKCATRKK